jgi:signal transduction histidine kinase
MKEMASIAAEAISRSRQQEEMRWPLRALAEVGRVAGQQSPQADDLLKSSLERVRSVAEAQSAHVLMWNRATASWRRRDHDGAQWLEVNLPAPGNDQFSSSFGLDWERVKNVLSKQGSNGLITPLSDAQGDVGVLVLVSPKFGAEEFHQRLDLILPVLTAVRLREFAVRVTDQIGQLRCLHLIAIHIQSFPHSAQTVLRLILTGVTAEEGLGFSRGVILLWNEDKGTLDPVCAVGAHSLAESKAAWSEVRGAMADVSGMEDRLERLLRRVEDFANDNQIQFCQPLTEAVLNPDVTLEDSAITECFQHSRTVEVGPDRDDAWRRRVRSRDEPDADLRFPFVCVPLRQGKRVRGVMVVDNRFLPRQMVINADRKPHLEAFAGLCAASLANAEHQVGLAKDLGETKRDVQTIVRRQSELALAQLHRSLAHELHGPIEKAASELSEAVAIFEYEKGETLLQRIELARSLIQRARQIMNRSRFVAEDFNEKENVLESFRRISLDEIKKAVRSMVRHHRLLNTSVTFADDYSPDLGSKDVVAFGDLPLLEQAFWELLTNASRYSEDRATVTIHLGVAGGAVIFRVGSKGIPLRSEDTEECKARGWRSREARAYSGEGSGFGLFMVNRIVRVHNGVLLVESTDADGVTKFQLRIPLI